MFKTVEWKKDKVVLLDQTKLPWAEVYVECRSARAVASAIKRLIVRGAPAIGVAAAMGIALGARRTKAGSFGAFYRAFDRICNMMARTRPTAVNLFWSIDRMRSLVLNNRERTVRELQHLLEREAIRIAEEDVEVNRRIARHGKAVIGDRQNVLTYCNAGALATAGYGTALGVVRAACEAGRKVRVIACETRPVLQGARLTVWELQQSCIDVTLITDNMAGYMMKMGGVDVVVVGADRVAANGDVANKIGTYSVAVLAKEHGIPFYVAAPISTLDPELTSGDAIPIEEREGREVIYFGTKRVAPKSVETWNPAFDVTPSRLVTGIITERGIVRKPYRTNIKGLLKMG